MGSSADGAAGAAVPPTASAGGLCGPQCHLVCGFQRPLPHPTETDPARPSRPKRASRADAPEIEGRDSAAPAPPSARSSGVSTRSARNTITSGHMKRCLCTTRVAVSAVASRLPPPAPIPRVSGTFSGGADVSQWGHLLSRNAVRAHKGLGKLQRTQFSTALTSIISAFGEEERNESSPTCNRVTHVAAGLFCYLCRRPHARKKRSAPLRPDPVVVQPAARRSDHTGKLLTRTHSASARPM
jgi:hypothetical protein